MLPLPHTLTHTHTLSHTHTNCAQPRLGTDVQTQSSEQPASRRLVLSLTAVSVSVVIDVAILLRLPSSLPLRRLYFQHYSLEARLSTIVRESSKQAVSIATYLLLCTYPPPHFGLLRLHSAIIVGASRRGPDDYRTTITTTSKSIVHR